MSVLEKLVAEYARLAHAMQSGVAAWMSYDQAETTPKHLRVGVNSALSNSSALGALLIRKGLITEQEYYEVITDGMKKEVASYEKMLSERTGQRITLV